MMVLLWSYVSTGVISGTKQRRTKGNNQSHFHKVINPSLYLYIP